MNDLLINQALLTSFVLSICYAFALEQVHDWYSPNGIVFTVILGDGFILATLVYLEWRGVPLTAWLVFEVMLAWGVPIMGWQGWQWKRRRDQLKGS